MKKTTYKGVGEDALEVSGTVSENDEGHVLSLDTETVNPSRDLNALASVLNTVSDLDLLGSGQGRILGQDNGLSSLQDALTLLGSSLILSSLLRGLLGLLLGLLLELSDLLDGLLQGCSGDGDVGRDFVSAGSSDLPDQDLSAITVNLKDSSGGLVGELGGTVAGLVMALGLVDVSDYLRIVMKKMVKACVFFLCGCWVSRAWHSLSIEEGTIRPRSIGE